MYIYRILKRICIAISILLSNIMCAVISYTYCDIQWGSKYECWSAPSSVAFLYAIPFIIIIIVFIVLALIFHKKAKKYR